MIGNRPGPAKPCLALMGEFSAGKSTLANLLIGADPLPVQVIATQLPPVCISWGDAAPYSVGTDGTITPIDLNELAAHGFEGVAYVQIFCIEDILQHCDILDMPGISDPTMSPEVWQRMIGKADGVLWCSHATQAWRQSEAAVWADLPEALRERSLLLLTRIDKLRTELDRARVLKRVRSETEGLFAEVLPISLLLATTEQHDYARWSQSGAEAFAASLVGLLARLNAELTGAGAAPDATGSQTSGPQTCGPEANGPQTKGPEATRPQAAALRLVSLEGPARPPEASGPLPAAAANPSAPAPTLPRIVPRRVGRPQSAQPRPAPH